MQYDAIIIGAGAGALAAALKLSACGKKVLILERQAQAGGFATMFTRKNFRFESAIHCINALGEGGEIIKVLDDLGITKNIELISLKDFSRIIYPEHDFVADFNRVNFLNFLENSFPHEKENLSRLLGQMDKFYKQFDDFNASNLPINIRLLKGIFRYQDFFKISTFTVNQLLDPYIKDEKLKGIFTDIWKFLGLPPSRLSALYYLIALRGYYFLPNCYIKGGSSQLFAAMLEMIKEGGSQIKYNTTVKEIKLERGKKVKAVVSEQGEEFSAKVVISDANAISTLCELINVDNLRQRYYEKLSKLEKSISAFQVYLGLDTPTQRLGMENFMLSVNTSYNQEENYRFIAENNYDRCLLELVDHSKLDPSFAPAGKSTLTIIAFDLYKHWEGLDIGAYKNKKAEIANKLIKRAEFYLPHLASHIEVMEVATPKTMSRFTLSPEGAIYGFAQTVKQSGINRLPQETEIRGLLLTGAWTRPGGGFHACFMSGIDAAETALKMIG